MPASPFFLESPIPPQLDLAGAPSQLFQVPPTPSASSALYRSISIPNRKRSRLEVDRRPWLDVDTPSNHVASVISPDDLLLGVEDTSVDHVYRPNRYRKPRSLALDDSVESLSETPAPVRWSRAVLGVVGKVWDFCWSGAFRGFYAGGGQGYTMTAEDAQPQLASPSIEKESISTSQRQQGSSSPFPGQYPEDDLKHSWVFVSAREEFMDEASPSQRRRVHRRTPAHTHSRRRSQGKRTLISHAPSMPTKLQFSSPAKPRESPVSVETQRYMAQKRRMEREEDASLARLNRQLQAMIKEGKQALGTRVEVDDLDMED
ncbi:Fungal specific transcription factor domain family protein [Aspergillus niger]|uniref:Fungal specific transcription factor domain family protein n=1 Tax=Aspergillus niger TaxID=5061 RepID=A0A505I8B1_ASPNG|nr:Fungal specific transcription factor domain family protein [Aspergillus niger]